MTDSKDNNNDVYKQIIEAHEKKDIVEVNRIIKDAIKKGNTDILEDAYRGTEKYLMERARAEETIVRLNQRFNFLKDYIDRKNEIIDSGRIKSIKAKNRPIFFFMDKEVPERLFIDLYEVLYYLIERKRVAGLKIDTKFFERLRKIRNHFCHGNITDDPAILKEKPIVTIKESLSVLTYLKNNFLSIKEYKEAPDNFSKSEVDNLIEFITGVKPNS